VTEAGFGAYLGAEKVVNIKCVRLCIEPAAVVLVATIRALKYHGGRNKNDLNQEDMEALAAGLPNLERHVKNITETFGLPCVVALNRFPADTEKEIVFVQEKAATLGVEVALSEVFAKGSSGGIELANAVIRASNTPSNFQHVYELDMPLKAKMEAVAKKIYRANGLILTAEAVKQIRNLQKLGYGNLPVCMAKTQYSFSDDPKRLGAANDFTITVRAVRLSAGAGFVVALTGDLLTMPGLPKIPAAMDIDVDVNGVISGLF